MNFNGAGHADWGQLLPAGSNYSIEAWIWRGSTSGSQNIVSTAQSPFWFNSSTYAAGVGGNYTSVSISDSTTGAWMHVAVTFDDASNTMVLYRNGIQVARSTSVTQSFIQEMIRIGAHTSSQGNAVSQFVGRIAQVRLYNRALSGQEISHNRSVTLVS
jgi:hypothetical protein